MWVHKAIIAIVMCFLLTNKNYVKGKKSTMHSSLLDNAVRMAMK